MCGMAHGLGNWRAIRIIYSIGSLSSIGKSRLKLAGLKGDTMKRYILTAVLLAWLSGTNLVLASIQTYQFTFENDGNLSALPPYGSLMVDDAIADQLKFTIDVDNAKLGAGADVEQFGFNLDFAGAVSLVPPGTFGGVALSLDTNKKVKGRNSFFDLLVDFGQGTPVLEPVMFAITGTGLDLTALDILDVSTQNNKPNANFAAHVQNTSATTNDNSNPDSESIGGLYYPMTDPGGDPDPDPGTVQEPTSLLVWSLLAVVVANSRRS